MYDLQAYQTSVTFPSNSATPGLVRALAISVVAHGVLLLQDDFQASNPRLTQPLTAMLKTPGISVDAQKVRPPSPPAAHAEPVARKPAAIVPPDAGSPPPRSASASADASAMPPAEAVPAAPANGFQPGIAANATPGEGLDADAMRAYRVALATELRRFKNYPPRAVEAGWSGTVEVSILINAAGGVQSVQLTGTSGYRVLDEKALDMMRHAAPRTAVPEVLRGHAFSMKVPIAFTLDDE